MEYLIAIDDTDNPESKGTGFRARELGSMLAQLGKSKSFDVTRHQLLFDPLIPYTSHNSAACIHLASEWSDKQIIDFAANYLIENSATGSDAGLCVAHFNNVSPNIEEWGERAKKEVLTLEQAMKTASDEGIFVGGYTGTKGGIIGSLAAVGLRKKGNDGRFLHVKGMRELSGTFSFQQLMELADIDEIIDIHTYNHITNTNINLDEWWRPVLFHHKKTLFVEQTQNKEYEYRNISKDHLRSISS